MYIWGDTHVTYTLRGMGMGGGKNEMLSDVGGEGLASILDVQSLFFSLKKIGFAAWPDIMLIYYWQEIFLLTLTSDSEAIL